MWRGGLVLKCSNCYGYGNGHGDAVIGKMWLPYHQISAYTIKAWNGLKYCFLHLYNADNIGLINLKIFTIWPIQLNEDLFLKYR